MNEHAQALRSMLALLPTAVNHVDRDTIHAAAIDIDRLDAALRGKNYNGHPTYAKPPAPPSPPRKKTTPYSCNVKNCGNGKCVHKLLDEECPFCGNQLVEVTSTGFKFCSNTPRGPDGCEYEKAPV